MNLTYVFQISHRFKEIQNIIEKMFYFVESRNITFARAALNNRIRVYN